MSSGAERAAELRRLVRAGVTKSEIARQWGLTRERVRQLVEVAGLQSAYEQAQRRRRRQIDLVAVAAGRYTAHVRTVERSLGLKAPMPHRVALRKHSDIEIVGYLREAAAQHPQGKLSMPVYDRLRRAGRPWPTCATVVKWFGSWPVAAVAAGLEPAGVRRGPVPRWSVQQLEALARDYAYQELRSGNRPSWRGLERWLDARQGPSTALMRSRHVDFTSIAVREADIYREEILRSAQVHLT